VQDLLIIRHGESQWNVEHRWQGWLDAPLTALGEKQALQRAEAIAQSGFSPATIHCSDLGRARQTAEIVAGILGAEVAEHSSLRERSGGDWQGHTSEEIDARWPGMRLAWRRGELAAMPGGEQDAEVLARVDPAIAEILAGPTPVMIVTHHGVLRLLATRAGAAIDSLIANLGGYWFRADRGELAHPEALEPLATAHDLPTSE
jgi:broad specificity phosphatase PhoE